MRRNAYTLIELLVVIFIIALLLGISLAAIQKVRAEYLRLQSINKLRQIIVGFHNLSSEEEGKISKLPEGKTKIRPFYEQNTIHTKLIPYVTGINRQLEPNPSEEEILDFLWPRVPEYISPADPTIGDFHPAIGLAEYRKKVSYASNMMAFDSILILLYRQSRRSFINGGNKLSAR